MLGGDVLAGVRGALAGASEAQRYQLLAALLTDLAGAAATPAENSEHAKGLSQKVQQLEKTLADQRDAHRSMQADLEVREKQQRAAEVRAEASERKVAEVREQLETCERERKKLETSLVDANSKLHQAENEREKLTLTAQRAELASQDRSESLRLQESKAQLAAELEEFRRGMDQLRAEKNAEIEQLQGQLKVAGGAGSQAAMQTLAALWDRLAAARPPLAHGGSQPTPQAGERLIEAFIELAAFAQRFDQNMRDFLNRYTRGEPALLRKWQAYAGEELYPIIQQVVDPKGGKPVGILKIKLNTCQKWSLAAMLANDAAIESICSELRGHLRGTGAGPDPKLTVRSYLQGDGPEAFQSQLIGLRRENLSKAFGA